MIHATVKSNIKFPKFNFQNDLMNIAKKIFIPLMQSNIDSNRSITGGKFPNLEPATIRAKGSRKPLINTGTLRSSFRYKRKGKLAVMINLKATRSTIGKYLQIDGIRSKRGMKHFNFFGVTEGMRDDALSYMRSRIRKAIKRA